MNFAFYDLETTGTSTAFDHPLQFAAILTDLNFKEIERVNLRCRLAPHVIPSPQALVVTGLRPLQIVDPQLPSLFEFAQKLIALVSRWSPAIWTGFNSIRFDEEMLRQLFYQNLQAEIFATQFNGNTRFDIMTAVFAMFQRHPDQFTWPMDDTGRVRFKLDRLAPENGFKGHNAHDALGDVEATIHIARLIAERAPDLWGQLLANRDKRHVQVQLDRYEPIELIGRFGDAPSKAIMGCLCGYAAKNQNQAYLFDLDAMDPQALIMASDQDLMAARDAEPRLLRSISINKIPVLLPPLTLTDEYQRRARALAEGPELRQRLISAMATRYPAEPDATPRHVEQQIFNGFYSWNDKARLKEFQGADWPRRQEIVATFEDARLRQLGARLVAFYAPNLLSDSDHRRYIAWRSERWSADTGAGWMTFEHARQALLELQVAESQDPSMLEEIEAFIVALGSSITCGEPF
ncbi:MAG: exodeoxyribonuclease I [Marivita sp.]|uniref:exonuclease domain-containing protein n=1 Tax=Marivita sp. TaxID=2003365 RepID=UPI001B2B74C4|nr:exonuclease domain-containing protein [Marivita sp.]MBO6883046.1 exodeoxyribonuclease I [Marivita sp.]